MLKASVEPRSQPLLKRVKACFGSSGLGTAAR